MFPALKTTTRGQRSGLLSSIGIWTNRVEMGSKVGLCGVWGLGADVFECCVNCNIRPAGTLATRAALLSVLQQRVASLNRDGPTVRSFIKHVINTPHPISFIL
jgi:hypothetical protein